MILHSRVYRKNFQESEKEKGETVGKSDIRSLREDYSSGINKSPGLLMKSQKNIGKSMDVEEREDGGKTGQEHVLTQNLSFGSC